MKIVTFFKLLYNSFVKRDDWSRYYLAEKIFYLIYPKMKISEYGNIYHDDVVFKNYYEKYVGNNFHSYDRKYTLMNILKIVKNLNGHYAECGVFEGATSYLIAEAMLKNEQLFLYDTFEGLSKPSGNDGHYWEKGDLFASEDLVKSRLAKYENIQYRKGYIPDRFDEDSSFKFKFVHVDVDLYQPTRDSIEFFYDHMVPGGIILCDDYGFYSCPGAKKAFDEIIKTKPENIVFFPTGQAFIIKE